MIDTIRSLLDHIRRKPSPELTASRVQTHEMEERATLTRKLLDSPETMTRFDLAKLIDEAHRGNSS